MKKQILISLIVAVITLAFTSNVSASWSKKSWAKNRWYDNDWNPYNVWCPRFWIKEMVNMFDDDTPYRRGYYGPYSRVNAPYAGYYPYGRRYYAPAFAVPP